MAVELLNPPPKGLPGAKPEPPAPPPQPSPTFYADTRVIAYRLPESEVRMADAHPRITASQAGVDLRPSPMGNFRRKLLCTLIRGNPTFGCNLSFLSPTGRNPFCWVEGMSIFSRAE